MTQQILNRKSLGGSGRKGHQDMVIAAVLLIALLAAAAMALNNQRQGTLDSAARTTGMDATLSAIPQDRAFYTEPYWEMGRVTVEEPAAPATSPAYFTEMYWDLAAARTARPDVSAAPVFSTEQYWAQAAAHADAAHAAASETSEATVFSTEQYWALAADSAKPRPETTEPEWATYTDRYWSLAGK